MIIDWCLTSSIMSTNNRPNDCSGGPGQDWEQRVSSQTVGPKTALTLLWDRIKSLERPTGIVGATLFGKSQLGVQQNGLDHHRGPR